MGSKEERDKKPHRMHAHTRIHTHKEELLCVQGQVFERGHGPGWASLVAQMVKNPPAMQETWVQSLGWEDALEEETATHSSILDWEIPRTEEPGEPQSQGSQRMAHDWVTNTFTGQSALG